MGNRQYIDYVGLNTFIYEASGWDPDQQTYRGVESTNYEYVSRPINLNYVRLSLNHIGMTTDPDSDEGASTPHSLTLFKNYRFKEQLGDIVHHPAPHFHALMLKRNGPYGWPGWKHLRISQNPLTRRQVQNNIF